MGYVFISSNSRNEREAKAIRLFLNKNGVTTWMAPGDIPAGSIFAEAISDAIKNSSCFLLLVSKESQNSYWVARETERAVNYKIPILPVCLEPIKLNKEFEFYLCNCHIVLLPNLDENAMEMKQLLNSASIYANQTRIDIIKSETISTMNVPLIIGGILLTLCLIWAALMILIKPLGLVSGHISEDEWFFGHLMVCLGYIVFCIIFLICCNILIDNKNKLRKPMILLGAGLIALLIALLSFAF